MAEELRESEAVLIEAGPVRPVPVQRPSGAIQLWGREIGPVAIASTAGWSWGSSWRFRSMRTRSIHRMIAEIENGKDSSSIRLQLYSGHHRDAEASTRRAQTSTARTLAAAERRPT